MSPHITCLSIKTCHSI